MQSSSASKITVNVVVSSIADVDHAQVFASPTSMVVETLGLISPTPLHGPMQPAIFVSLLVCTSITTSKNMFAVWRLRAWVSEHLVQTLLEHISVERVTRHHVPSGVDNRLPQLAQTHLCVCRSVAHPLHLQLQDRNT